MKYLAIIIFFYFQIISQTTNDENLLRLAQGLENVGEFERARNIFDGLLKNNKNNYNYFDGVKRNSIFLKDYNRALEVSVEWLKIMPSDVSTEANIGGIYYLLEKEKEADSVWNKILINKNLNEMAFRIVANTQIEYRLFEKAIDTYKKGRLILKNNSLFSLELSSYYTSLLMYREATIESLNYLNEQNQQFDYILARLSQIIKLPASIPHVRKVIVEENAKRKDSYLYLKLKQWIEIESKDFEEAKNTTIEIDKLSINKSEELFLFGKNLFQLGEYEISKEILLTINSINPNFNNSIQVLYHIAKSYSEIFFKSIRLENKNLGFKVIDEVKVNGNKYLIDSAIFYFKKVKNNYPTSEYAVRSDLEISKITSDIFNDLDESERILDILNQKLVFSHLNFEAKIALANIKIKKNKLSEAENIYFNLKRSATKNELSILNFKIAMIKFYSFEFKNSIELLNVIASDYENDETNDALKFTNLINENIKLNLEGLKLFASAMLLNEQKRNIDALVKLNLILSEYKTYPIIEDALILKAKIEIELTQFEKGISTFRKLNGDYPHGKFNIEAKYYIAVVHDYYLNNKNEAIKSYEEVILVNPNSIYAEKSRNRIRILRNENI